MTLDRAAASLITGARGMLGSAIARALRREGFTSVLTPPRNELDLFDARAVDRWFAEHRPRYVFMSAARVGGIAANLADPVGFLEDNLVIQLNLFRACRAHAVEKCLFAGSSCVYPRESPQPMREECLMQGPPEPTNEGYALAKIVGINQAASYRKEYGLRTVVPIFCNLYGTNDHFDFAQAHVLSSLVRRFADAVEVDAPTVTVWGTGRARREFMHVDDAAEASLFLMDHYEEAAIVNVGPGSDVSIHELVDIVSSSVGYRGAVEWDHSKPDGMPRKCVDATRLRELGFGPRIALVDGVRRTVEEYKQRKAQGSGR